MEQFTAKDISVIIKSCKDSGVRSLDYGGLKLSFEPEESTTIPNQGLHLAPLIEGNEQELFGKEVEDDPELRDLELQNLMISDPVGYEKHMRYEDDLQ